MKINAGNLVGVLIVTAGALVLMVTIGAGAGLWTTVFGNPVAENVEKAAIARAAVQIREVSREPIEIVDSYYGIVRPLERYDLAFEAAGRIEQFGTNKSDRPLDVEDQVSKGQVLARLDTRLLAAQLNEAKSRLEQAQAEMRRADERDARNVITAEEYQERVTALEIADAQVQVADKRLQDATLVAPVDGVLSKRMANMGESVGPNETIFELLEVDRVLLVVEVPESRIQSIRNGQRVEVTLRAKDAFGRIRRTLKGSVYQVAEAADDRTGVFEVEIILENPDRMLKPGLVAVGRIIVDEIEGFRLPDYAAVMRDGKNLLFAVDLEGNAIAHVLTDYVEQEGELIIPMLPDTHRKVVVGGQHRLVAGRAVEIIELEGNAAAESRPEVSVRATTVDTGS